MMSIINTNIKNNGWYIATINMPKMICILAIGMSNKIFESPFCKVVTSKNRFIISGK